MLIISEFDPRAEYPKLELTRFDNADIFAAWLREIGMTWERRVTTPGAYRLFYFVNGSEYSRAPMAKIGMDVDIEFFRATTEHKMLFAYRIGTSPPVYFDSVVNLAQYLWAEYVM